MVDSIASTEWDAERLELASVADVLTHFSTSPDIGLTKEEAARRLKEWGPNALPEHEQSAIVKFLLFL